MTPQNKSKSRRHSLSHLVRVHRLLAVHLVAIVVTIVLRVLGGPRCGGA
jgi:hypothetical protein